MKQNKIEIRTINIYFFKNYIMLLKIVKKITNFMSNLPNRNLFFPLNFDLRNL